MISLNTTIIAGNLTRDPQVRYFNETAVASFTIANTRRFKTNGESREETLFLDCTAWGKTAETIAKHFLKGKPIVVEGRLKNEHWEDKQTGAKRSKILLVVDTFHFVPDGKRGESSPETAPAEPVRSTTVKEPAPTASTAPTASNDEPPF